MTITAVSRRSWVAATSLLLALAAAIALYSLPRPTAQPAVVVTPPALRAVIVTAPALAPIVATFVRRANALCKSLDPPIDQALARYSAATNDRDRGRAYRTFVLAYRRRADREALLQAPLPMRRGWKRIIDDARTAVPLLLRAASAMTVGDKRAVVRNVTAAEKHTVPAREWAIAQSLPACS